MHSVLVTGISRRAGIGWAIADRLLADGWTVAGTGWPAHDAEQPWAADRHTPQDFAWTAADLADPAAPAQLVREHVSVHGSLDALVAVHARSSQQDLGSLTAAELDASFAVNTRATLLLMQAAAQAGARRIVVFTTGVHREPMPDELPYAVSKAALQGITTSLAAALAPSGITVNCVNPGPNDTGWANESTHERIASQMPLARRWGQPADTAELVAWLLSDAAGWITGQTIDSDGGWSTRSGR
jgi:3-oxoacyl-[acyl-carrier protein] reductase